MQTRLAVTPQKIGLHIPRMLFLFGLPVLWEALERYCRVNSIPLSCLKSEILISPFLALGGRSSLLCNKGSSYAKPWKEIWNFHGRAWSMEKKDQVDLVSAPGYWRASDVEHLVARLLDIGELLMLNPNDSQRVLFFVSFPSSTCSSFPRLLHVLLRLHGGRPSLLEACK